MQLGGVRSTSHVAKSFMGTGRLEPPKWKGPKEAAALGGVAEVIIIPPPEAEAAGEVTDVGGAAAGVEIGVDTLPLPPAPEAGRKPLTALAIAAAHALYTRRRRLEPRTSGWG